jgi:hypothetical protein
MVFGVVKPFGSDATVLQREQRYFQRAARFARLSHVVDSRRLRSAFLLFRTTMLVNSACLIRRSCVELLGGYRPEIKVVEDVDFYARAVRRFGSVFLDRPVIGYRCGAPSIMSGQKDSAVIESSYEKMYEAYRRRHGAAELAALRTLARTVLRFLLAVATVAPGADDVSEMTVRNEDVVGATAESATSATVLRLGAA